MRKNIGLWLASVCLFASGTVSASLFNFNYSNLSVSGGDIVKSAEMMVDGITVNITAYTVDNDGSDRISAWQLLENNDTGVYVSGSRSGNLGVKSSAYDGSLLDGGNTDKDLDEGLLFSFSDMVSLDYLNFDYFTERGGDDFNLTVDGVQFCGT